MAVRRKSRIVPTYLFDGNVGEINGYAGCSGSIVERKLVYGIAQANQETKCLEHVMVSNKMIQSTSRTTDLANTSTGAENSCDVNQ